MTRFANFTVDLDGPIDEYARYMLLLDPYDRAVTDYSDHLIHGGPGGPGLARHEGPVMRLPASFDKRLLCDWLTGPGAAYVEATLDAARAAADLDENASESATWTVQIDLHDRYDRLKQAIEDDRYDLVRPTQKGAV